VLESYSNYKLNHRSVEKRTSLQPICSFKLINEMTLLWIFDKNFFSKSWASKLGMWLICECSLYASVYGDSYTSEFNLGNYVLQNKCFMNELLLNNIKIHWLSILVWQKLLCQKTSLSYQEHLPLQTNYCYWAVCNYWCKLGLTYTLESLSLTTTFSQVTIILKSHSGNFLCDCCPNFKSLCDYSIVEAMRA